MNSKKLFKPYFRDTDGIKQNLVKIIHQKIQYRIYSLSPKNLNLFYKMERSTLLTGISKVKYS